MAWSQVRRDALYRNSSSDLHRHSLNPGVDVGAEVRGLLPGSHPYLTSLSDGVLASLHGRTQGETYMALTNILHRRLFIGAATLSILTMGAAATTLVAQSSFAQTSPTPSPTSPSGAVHPSNEDAAHEASETAEQEAAEDAGQGHFGAHGSNEDSAHEANETKEQEAAEDAGQGHSGPQGQAPSGARHTRGTASPTTPAQ